MQTMETPIPNEEELANCIAGLMLESNCFKSLGAQAFRAKREAFIVTMVRRFGGHHTHEVVRRVAAVQFETGLEIIKLREGHP
jgi:hypothetical protein